MESVAIFRPSDLGFYLRNTLTQGNADSSLIWDGANASWLPIAGPFGLS